MDSRSGRAGIGRNYKPRLVPRCLGTTNPNRQSSSKLVLLEYNKGDDLTYWEQVKPLLADDVKIDVKETMDIKKGDPKFVYPVISFIDMNMMNVDPPVSISVNTNRNFTHIKDRVLNLGPKWNQLV
jgi:hypothetical protein